MSKKWILIRLVFSLLLNSACLCAEIIVSEVRFSDQTPAALANVDVDFNGTGLRFDFEGKSNSARLRFDDESELPSSIYSYNNLIHSPYSKEMNLAGWPGGGLEVYREYFPSGSLLRIGQGRYAAILNPDTKSVQISMPDDGRDYTLYLCLMHYSGPHDMKPYFYFVFGGAVRGRGSVYRIPLPYMEWLKTSKSENLKMKGYACILEKGKNRINRKYFDLPDSKGGVANVIFEKKEGEENRVKIKIQYANGQPAAMARMEITENGFLIDENRYQADQDGEIWLSALNPEDLELYPSLDGFSEFLMVNRSARANIDSIHERLEIGKVIGNELIAILPSDTKSVLAKGGTMLPGGFLRLTSAAYKADNISMVGTIGNVNPPFELRVPLPYVAHAYNYEIVPYIEKYSMEERYKNPHWISVEYFVHDECAIQKHLVSSSEPGSITEILLKED